MTKKTEAAAEAAALAARAQKLLQQTKAKNNALLERSTRTKAVSQPEPMRRPKPQAAAEPPTPTRPVMRSEKSSEVMSFPEREERAFILDGGAFMASAVSLLLAAGQAAAAAAEDDEGEAE